MILIVGRHASQWWIRAGVEGEEREDGDSSGVSAGTVGGAIGGQNMIQYLLAIDPGTRCGWAARPIQETTGMIAGVWELKEGRFEGCGMRIIR